VTAAELLERCRKVGALLTDDELEAVARLKYRRVPGLVVVGYRDDRLPG